MSLIVKAADAAQFLSLVPRLLGCTPTRSLVLVPMARGRSLGAMRLDLPPEDLVDTVASRAIGMVCRIAEADAVVVVVYTDEAIGDAGGADARLPGHAVVDAVGEHAHACGLRVVDALTVAGDGWGPHDDAALPPGGYPLDQLRVRDASAGDGRDDVGGGAADASTDAEAAASPPSTPDGGAPGEGEAARDGSAPGSKETGTDASLAGDQASGATLPRVDAAARRAVALALESLSGALEILCGIPSMSGRTPRIDPAALEAACELDDLPALYEDALSWRPGDGPMRTAMLGWCLARPSLRDIALVQWASDESGGDIAIEAQRLWEDTGRYPSDLASTMWGEGPRPDPDRLAGALTLVRHVAALVPRTERPGPLAMCAWLSWAMGRSSHADRYATMALKIDDEHGLADIVRSFVRVGHLPDWAFRSR